MTRIFKMRGFTLVELLVAIAIIGILAAIGITTFTSAQVRGRDAKRKSDLKQTASALELFNSDYGYYPASDAGGAIHACPFTLSGGTACNWGVSQFYDTDANGVTKTVYFQVLPKDGYSNYKYFYRVVSADADGTGQKFQIFTHLENPQDINCLPDATGKASCSAPVLPTGVSCGGTCNFAVTSPNTTPQAQ